MGFKVASRVRGLSDEAFREAFGTEEQCCTALVRLRWPDGFVCACCGHREHCVLAGRGLYQCNRCKKQTSPTAGTIFHATKLPLTLWFAAIHLIVTAKNGISSVELGRRLGVKQPTAWTVKHKIMAVMARREGETRLTGRVEMDDAYLGGVRSGGKRGRGAAGKTPFVAAVSTSPEGRPRKLKLAPVKGFRKREIARGAKHWLAPGAAVVTDGLGCWSALDEAACSHQAIRTGSGRQAARMASFKWVNTTLGNIKSAITGTYRKLGPDHAERYLASFAWRYNRRYQLQTIRLARGRPDAIGFIPYSFRPFDKRWLYWEEDSGLLARPSPDYRPHVFEGNFSLVSQQKPRREWSPPQVISRMGCYDLMDRNVSCFPVWLRDDGIGNDSCAARRANLSGAAQRYLDRLGLGVEDLFHHVLATLHDPSYREANAGALRMEWPRIPLPGWPDGEAEGAADALARSAALGRELAALLDSETPVSGVTQAPLRAEIAAIAVPATISGRYMAGDDFAVTAGWGHYGQGDAVMPGQGRVVERAFKPEERAAMEDALPALGHTTVDVYLNGNAFWRNVPAAVWTYKLGGYQVLKKWLSYRERDILRRKLKADEVQHFTDTARRIAAILCLAVTADNNFSL